MENELIPPAGYDLRMIPAYQLPRSVNMDLLRTPDRMWKSAHAAGKVIDEVQADVVVGFGGYVSVPAYLAAWRRELPIVIHEVNVPPGVANRMGMKFTKNVAVGFPHQPQQAESLRDARVVGVPLRTSIAQLDRAGAARRRRSPTSGCAPTCRCCSSPAARRAPARSTWRSPARPRSWPTPASRCCTCRAGATSRSTVPNDLPVPYVVVPYLSEMQLGYAAADLMLVPGRGDHGGRDHRDRAAGDLRAATRTATRSSGATRCRWSRPAAGCWWTTPSSPRSGSSVR